jgi:hypothetical protein
MDVMLPLLPSSLASLVAWFGKGLPNGCSVDGGMRLVLEYGPYTTMIGYYRADELCSLHPQRTVHRDCNEGGA